MICEACLDFYIVPSRLPRLCKKCEAEAISEAAKQVDEKAMNISDLSNWIQTNKRPRKYKKAWKVE